MILVGMKRPYTALIIACLLAVEDPRLNADLGDIQQNGFAMWPLYWGVAFSPSNIFLILIAALSFFWRSCRSIPGPLMIYAVGIILAGIPGLLMGRNFSMAFSAWFLHVVIPVIICVNSVRSITGPAALHRLWLLLLVGILVPAIYHAVTRLGMGEFTRGAIANQMTPYALGLVPVAFLWATKQTKAWQRALGAVCVVAFVTIIWVSGSRTGALLALMYLVWRGLRSITWLARRPGILVTSALLTMGMLAYVTSSYAFQTRKYTLLGRFSELAQSGISQTSRWQLWLASIELIKHNPIFGIGLNNTVLLLNFSSSHQILLSIWLEMGFLGVLAFAGICIYVIGSGLAMLWRLPTGLIKDDMRCTMDMFILTFLYLQVAGYLYGTFSTSGTYFFHTLLACVFLARCFAREQKAYQPAASEDHLFDEEIPAQRWVYR
jgi:O-antigen ligase